MKKIYLYTLLLLVFTARCFARAPHVFKLDKFPKRDTLVTGWVFHTGDNTRWKQPGADDKDWKTINPDTDVTHFDPLKNAGIGWLRVHIRVDSSLAGDKIAASITQYTASEIYLNGALVAKYGTVSTNPSEVKAYLPSKEPLVIGLVPGKDNVIAVRLAYQRGIPYLSSLFEPLPVFSLSVNDYQNAAASYYSYQDRIKYFVLMFALFGGMVLIVFFTYMVYYLFNRKKRVYLYYALFCFSICYITLPNEVYGVERYGPLTTQMWLVFAEGTNFVIGMVLLLLTIYTMFDYPRRSILIVLSVIGIISIVLMFFFGTTFFFGSTTIIPLVFMLEGIHVCVWAIRRRIKDAAYVLTGTVCFVLLIAISGLLDQGTILAQTLWGVGIVCFPLGMAFYLGIQSSLINKQLEFSLVEVQMLSAQKQQILADQNIVLEHQVEERTAELNQSLSNLRSTQTQLVQREKMASLGELTAGIAHEIQNPLNFVNNFSEVSVELLQELKEEAEAGRTADVIAIADDLTNNLEKINHHGKRADAIVKGMLEHSRVGTGGRVPTDINALADEYLRLSYHGSRAKDKAFNAEMVTHFDPDLPKINVIPQDIGRVMINLFNNAFYAVNQKKKTAGADYKPEVVVTILTENGQTIIKVRDNGIGIPEHIKEKIMQPFFTTKPTGEGTGLGLSLTYDMVVKGHGGSIAVDTQEGEYTEFKIQLPV